MPDILGNTSTTSTIIVGGSASNVLEVNGDHDWFRIELTAGQKITINLDGLTLEDSYLRMRDSAGNLLAENDDISSGTVRDSRLVFTATTTGTYYIDVGAFNEAYSGTYQLNVDVYTPPPVATYSAFSNHLTNGYWGGDSHHFNVTQGGTVTVNLTLLTASGQGLAREALGLWSDITGITFAEVSSGGQITFDDNESGAFSDGTWSGGIISSSHVNVSTQWLTNYGTTIGSYSFQTYIHEIGHALGLGHAGFYNGSAVYGNDALFANDGWPVTVMSYFDQQESLFFNDQGFSRAFVVTPMLVDIRAIGTLYGLSTTTRTGDTTYGFDNNSGRSVYTASVGSTITALTIFDSGGVDTLNYSGFASNQIINLTPEVFSNIGGGIGNVVIALGTLIENALGGSGSDSIFGNSANNMLNGGAGNDTLDGGAGNDTLIGGVGVDILTGGTGDDIFRDTAAGLSGDTIADFAVGDKIVFTDATLAGFTFSLSGSTLTYTGGSLTLTGGVAGTLVATAAVGGGVQLAIQAQPDAINGTAGDDTLTGTSANETINGLDGNDTINGLAGDDSLNGGVGNDLLDGGAGSDTLVGGAGNDIFIVDSVGDVVTELAGEGTDEVQTTLNSYTLPGNVEILRYVGTGNFTGTGGSGGDTLFGNIGADTLNGLAGNDTINGGAGGDTLIGGVGADILTGGTGDDSFRDTAAGLSGDTITDFAAGDKIVFTDATLAGFTFNLSGSTLTYTGGSLTLTGGVAGALVASAAVGGGVQLAIQVQQPTTINGTAGDDTLTGTSASETLNGLAGNDIINGGAGNDTLDGGAGNDTLIGGVGVDILTGGAGDDIFRDTKAGLSGDTITDFAVGDKIVITDATLTGSNDPGSAGFTFNLSGNTLTYTGGSLTLTGGVTGTLVATAVIGGGVQLAIQAQQSTTINGTAGDDTLTGTSASETINGLDGNDTISGLAGNDSFVYYRTADSTITSGETISNFGAGDKTSFFNFDAGADSINGDTPFMFIDAIASSTVAGQLHTIEDPITVSKWFVEADVDGYIPDLGIRDMVTNNYPATSGDFYL